MVVDFAGHVRGAYFCWAQSRPSGVHEPEGRFTFVMGT